MFGGGMALTAAQKKELLDLQKQADARSEVIENFSNKQYEAQEELGKVSQDASYARQRAEAAKNRVDGAEEAAENYQHQVDDLRRQLEVSENNIARTLDLANFQKSEYVRKLMAEMQLAAVEAVCEQRNAFGEILRVWHAACMKMGAAIADTGAVSASVVFSPNRYLTPREVIADTSQETYAQAQSAKSDYDAQMQRVGEMQSDPFYANNIAEANAERTSANADHTSQEGAEASARASYESMRTEVQQAQAKLRDLNRQMRELQAKI